MHTTVVRMMFADGRTGLVTPHTCRARYLKAADHGHAKAMNALALLHLSETANIPNKSARRGVGWLSKAAREHEDPEAQSNLGVCYHQGVGTPQDDAKAKGLFRGRHTKLVQHLHVDAC